MPHYKTKMLTTTIFFSKFATVPDTMVNNNILPFFSSYSVQTSVSIGHQPPTTCHILKCI